MGRKATYRKLRNRGRGHGDAWVGASDHAVRQLRDRTGVIMGGGAWATVIANARAGSYPRMHEVRDHPSGTSQTYAVPMGTCAADMIIVPMVIDVDAGVVITVLDPT